MGAREVSCKLRVGERVLGTCDGARLFERQEGATLVLLVAPEGAQEEEIGILRGEDNPFTATEGD